MCKNCQTRPVYEFTNKRKLCKECFVKYFQKKVLYTIRKFGLIKQNEIIGYKTGTQGCTPKNIQKNIFTKGSFREVVLEDVLKMFARKGNVEIVGIPFDVAPPTRPQSARADTLRINKKLLNGNFHINVNSVERLSEASCGANNSRAKRGKVDKMAIGQTIDLTAYKIIEQIINGNIRKLNVKPIEGKIIKPLYLFLDKEVLLYAKIKKLKFKKESVSSPPYDPGRPTPALTLAIRREICPRSKHPPTQKSQNELSIFIDELELKHPEVKRAVVNGWLGISD